MEQPKSAVSAVLERLYNEVLVLSDEAKASFSPHNRLEPGQAEDGNLAFACEQARTTMLLDDAQRWLSANRTGEDQRPNAQKRPRPLRLSSCCRPADDEWLALLSPNLREIVRSIERLYERLIWLERGNSVRNPGRSRGLAKCDEVVSLQQ